jgi:hypothetical protein
LRLGQKLADKRLLSILLLLKLLVQVADELAEDERVNVLAELVDEEPVYE